MTDIDLAKVDFNTLTRDKLRSIASLHAVDGRSFHGYKRARWDSTKDDLVRGLKVARDEGKFGSTATTTGNSAITIKSAQTYVFLKGTGCSGREAYVAFASNDNGDVTVYADVDPSDLDYITDSEKFTTTPENLRAALEAIERV